MMGNILPILLKLITELPEVHASADGTCVQINVMADGVVVERIAMTPHMVLAHVEALRAQAIAIIESSAGAEILTLRLAEG